jgi:hypothetical protein
MKACVAGSIGSAHDLAVIIQSGRKDPKSLAISAKVTQIDRIAVLPQDSVKGCEIVLLNRIEGSTGSGAAGRLA